ncbi:MAG: hypothetical protein II894_07815, partial [Bacteroidales bacterium]|nr:hypothetical protein [Bacteroidales bacterium]
MPAEILTDRNYEKNRFDACHFVLYGFEYEYKNSDGNSGGGGVEPCAIVNGHMEAVLKIKPSASFQCYRYRPYYSTEVIWSE